MDPLQLLERIDAFYSNAFSSLITITVALLGFGAIILPLLLQYLQQRSFRIEQKSLHDKITRDTAASKGELNNELQIFFKSEKERLQQQIKGELKMFDIKLEEKISCAEAGIFFLQGNNNFRLQNYSQAVMDFAVAAEKYITGKDECNGRTSLDLIVSTLPELTKESFRQVSNLEGRINDLLKTLSDKNENGRFFEAITKITTGRNEAKERTPAKPV
jgi:hypothetical protein